MRRGCAATKTGTVRNAAAAKELVEICTFPRRKDSTPPDGPEVRASYGQHPMGAAGFLENNGSGAIRCGTLAWRIWRGRPDEYRGWERNLSISATRCARGLSEPGEALLAARQPNRSILLKGEDAG